MVQVTALFVYPVKSCGGISLAQAEVGPRGFRHDREFLIVDEADAFVTQRTAPELATVAVRLEQENLVLHHAGAGALRLPLETQEGTSRVRTPRRVKIFNDQVYADDVGGDSAEWFSAVLRRPARLVRTGASFSRRVSPEEIAPAHRAAEGPEIPFADAFPTMLASEESLAELNSRLRKPVPMNRFRPNIVVRGAAPYEEDTWKTIRAGNIAFGCAAPNLRCVITTIDQQTGTRDGSEPLRTLATYRRGASGGVMFGQYLVHSGSGNLRVGDVLVTDPNG